MHPTQALPAPAEPFHRLPELLGRLPLPAEAWAKLAPHVPAPVHDVLGRVGALARRIPDFSARQIFAAVVPAGLLLGWLVSYAVDPEIMQRGGKPYSEVAVDGVQVELPKLAYEYDGYPEDAAPFGYGPQRAEYMNAGLVDAGQYSDTAGPAGADEPDADAVRDGQVLGEDDGDAPVQQPVFTSRPVIEVVPQETPL